MTEITKAELDALAEQKLPELMDDWNAKIISSMGIPEHILESPLGMKPRWLVEEQRLKEVEAAIGRYQEVGKTVPKEWQEEKDFLIFRRNFHEQEKKSSPRLCVKGRNVVNDAVVGEWTNLHEIQPPTYEGIVKWMEKQGGYDLAHLVKCSTFDDHLVNYGLRYQFWVPMEQDFRKEAQEAQQGLQKNGAATRRMVVCKDDCGDCGLTKGQAYAVGTYSDDGMIRVVNDNGMEQDYFPERFEAESPVAKSEEISAGIVNNQGILKQQEDADEPKT